MTHHVNNAGTAAVSDVYYWQPMDICPHGVKVLLLGDGVATVGVWHGLAFWKGWFPLPRRNPLSLSETP